MFTGTIPIELSPPTYYSNTTTAPSYSYMLRHVHLQGNDFEGNTIDDVFCNNNVSALSTNSSDQSSYYPYYYYSLVADCSLREEVFCSCCTECCYVVIVMMRIQQDYIRTLRLWMQQLQIWLMLLVQAAIQTLVSVTVAALGMDCHSVELKDNQVVITYKED